MNRLSFPCFLVGVTLGAITVLLIGATSLAPPTYEQQLRDELAMRIMASMIGPGSPYQDGWRARCAWQHADAWMRIRDTPDVVGEQP